MTVEHFLEKSHDSNIAANWDDSHRYTPTSRHRRQILLRMLSDLGFQNCLDAGCAQPYLIQEIVHRFGVKGYGCDISDAVMAQNQEKVPECEFMALDLSKEAWPNQKFDLVVCSEVLEHIENWQPALANLVRMSRRYLLITVPGGKRRLTDEMLGHYRHYKGPELLSALEENGCTILSVKRWGFPVYDLYKSLISKVAPEKLYSAFMSGEQKYSWKQKLISYVLYLAFYANYLTKNGDQIIVLVRVD